MRKVLRLIQGKAHSASSSLPQERELILASQQGDSAAFKQLYDHYRNRIYNLICYTLKDTTAAEDALQSVFIKVYQALPFFRLESCLQTWIYRVAVNECKNRKRRTRTFVPIDQLVDSLEHGVAPPDVHHATERMSQLVRDAVMQLKPKYRQVIVLKYNEDLSYEEIASILNCAPGTVASRLHRALGLLEARLRLSDAGKGGGS